MTATTKFTKKLHVSPFIFSFLFLGLLTSIPEFSVGLQSIASDHGEIFVGNLLGGIIVLFLVVIPLLALIGNGISVKNELKGLRLILTSVVIATPALFVLDGSVTNQEGLIMIVMYFCLMLFIQRDNGILDNKNKSLMNVKKYSYMDLLKLIFGLGLVFIASRLLLDKTLFFAEALHISSFVIGLVVVALGTDMPEFILAVRSALQKKKDVAMGDYIGAAAASTLLFGIFTLLSEGESIPVGNFGITFIFIMVSLVLYFIFSRSKNFISRGEGLILFSIYLVFLFIEVATKS